MAEQKGVELKGVNGWDKLSTFQIGKKDIMKTEKKTSKGKLNGEKVQEGEKLRVKS